MWVAWVEMSGSVSNLWAQHSLFRKPRTVPHAIDLARRRQSTHALCGQSQVRVRFAKRKLAVGQTVAQGLFVGEARVATDDITLVVFQGALVTGSHRTLRRCL